MDALPHDIHYALRTLAKSRGFTLAALLTLALGIGAATAVFSVAYGVLLQSLPYPHAGQVVEVGQVGPRGGFGDFSDANFDDLHAQNRSLQAMAEFASNEASVAGGSEPVRARAAAVSREFFDALGVHPLIGRGFAAEELREGATPVALVSYAYWSRYLDRDTDLGKHRLVVNGRSYTIVGVMPPEFSFPADTALWTPREQFAPYASRTAHNWEVVARLKDGVTIEHAREDLSSIAKRLKQQYGENTWMVDAAVSPLRDRLVGAVRSALLVLMGATSCLLLLACANVANLLLARAVARRREIAVRVALGAGRWRVSRQLLVESLCLAVGGGLLGVLCAYWGVQAIVAAAAGRLPRAGEIQMSWPVVLFGAGVSLLTAGAIGMAAAWRATRTDPQEALQEGQRAGTGDESVQRLRGALVVSQLAISLVLLAGSGLLARSFLRLSAVDPGFRVSNVLTVHLTLESSEDAGQRRAAFLDRFLARLRVLPGVADAGVVSSLPLDGYRRNGRFLVMAPGQELTNLKEFERLFQDPVRTGTANYRVASAGYFRAMGIPLIRGRLFDERDDAAAPHAAVISEALVRQKWPGEDPIGQRIQFGNMDGDLHVLTVVGVVADVHDQGLSSPAPSMIYCDYQQRLHGGSDFTAVLHSGGDAAGLAPTVRGILREMDPALPPSFRTMEQVVSSSVADRWFNLILLSFFAGGALVLAATGVYGVMAYAVTCRTHEIGIRMALGAAPADVLQMVVTGGLRLAVAGVVIGLIAVLALSRLLAGLLYGVQPNDTLTLAGVSVLLAGVTLAACYLPARRAARVDPIEALRHE